MSSVASILNGTPATIQSGLIPTPGSQVLGLSGDLITLTGGGGSVDVGNTSILSQQNYNNLTNTTNFSANVIVGAIGGTRSFRVVGNTVLDGSFTPTTITDGVNSVGTQGQILSSTGSALEWITGGSASVASMSVLATSATPVALNTTLWGHTYILTGTTTQSFTTTSLTPADAGFFVIVKNGNGLNAGDITLSGVVSVNPIVHNQTNQQNGQIVYLLWNGTSLTFY